MTLPAGSSVTYTVNGTVAASATGTLSNTAAVIGAYTDSNLGDNAATDTDTIVAEADLSITKTDGVTDVMAGDSVTYTITASNAGPSDAPGATVTDAFPASISNASWACSGAGGATCTSFATGDINDTVNLPAGGSVTYTVDATIDPAATGSVVNTATVAAPAGVTDSNQGNDSATDTDTIVTAAGSADLSVAKDLESELVDGEDATYSLTVTNDGPDTAAGPIVLTDDLPDGLTFVSADGSGWTCGESGGTVTCEHAGDLADGESSTVTLVTHVDGEPGEEIVNTADVSSGTADPNDANNADVAAAALAITGPDVVPAGTLPRTGSPISALLALGGGLLLSGLLVRRSAVRA